MVLNLWIKGIIDKSIDNYLVHQIQQPILKLQIRNFHVFFQPIGFIFDEKTNKHTSCLNWSKKIMEIRIRTLGIGCWIR